MVANEDWRLNFYKYEKARKSGRYNIIMEAERAIRGT